MGNVNCPIEITLFWFMVVEWLFYFFAHWCDFCLFCNFDIFLFFSLVILMVINISRMPEIFKVIKKISDNIHSHQCSILVLKAIWEY